MFQKKYLDLISLLLLLKLRQMFYLQVSKIHQLLLLHFPPFCVASRYAALNAASCRNINYVFIFNIARDLHKIP